MRKFNVNFGVMVATVVLLVYAYIAFLGMLYKMDGVVWKATVATIGVIVAVALCVFIMVNSKVTKNTEIGIIGQILFGGAILLVFLLSGGPFTSFLKASTSRQEIGNEIEKVKNAAVGLDAKYNDYVEKRTIEYRTHGADNLHRMSLQRKLCPDSLAICQQQRQDWMSGIGDMSIWNISLPKNLQYMQQCVNDWKDNYVQLSSFAYDNLKLQPFEYNDFDESLKSMLESIKNAGYSFWAVLAAILAALTMMLPYWLAIPVKTPKRKEITYV